MVYVAHRVAGVHWILDAWLDSSRPSGVRPVTAREIAAWRGERGLVPLSPEGTYCPVCLRRVDSGEVERRLHREACASGEIDVWIHHCVSCGVALSAEVRTTEDA